LRKLLGRILERAGFAVLFASTPEAALQVDSDFTGEIHLLLTAYYPAGASRQDMGETLERRRRGLPVILLSSSVDAELLASTHGWDYATKPFELPVLLGMIERAACGMRKLDGVS
jgi:DNA-binding NtrC family response regulator